MHASRRRTVRAALLVPAAWLAALVLPAAAATVAPVSAPSSRFT